MNHLIHGVEISLEQGWTDLVEALTETGRILQSYEDAGRANACVPFLADSYEIMCLMVGDLIVDKVRPGVLRKWRDCYQGALDDLKAEGLSLVEDEDGGSRFPNHPTNDTTADDANHSEFPQDDMSVTSDRMQEVPSGLGELEDLPPLTSIPSDPSSDAPEMPFSVDGEAFSAESPFEDPDVDEAFATSELAPPEFDIPFELEGESESDAVPELSEDREERAPSTEESPSILELGTDVAEILDMLCDGLARMEGDPEGARGTVFLAIEDGLNSLHERAQQQGWHGSLAACVAMSRLCQTAAEQNGPLGDRFFETAYAFGGVYGEVKEQTDDESLRSWIAECEALVADLPLQSAATTPPAGMEDEAAGELPFEIPESEEIPPEYELELEVPSLNGADQNVDDSAIPPELPSEVSAEADALVTTGGTAAMHGPEEIEEQSTPPVESRYVEISSAVPAPADKSPEDETAAQFLETARLAMGSGAAADAKLYAMQAAASIAQAQARDAETRVRQAEIRLQETVKSIESAREQVKDAESQVEQAESRVEDGKEQLSERGRHTHGVLGSLEGIRSRITDLDRRIQELQMQRDEALRQQSAADEALNEARQQESDVKAQLDNLKNTEQMARVQLEDARGQVKQLQRKQGEIEALMERARDSLTQFRESMADIDRTIELIRNAETSAALENDDLLF
jgi:predicted  nucleic acid-binding Zn-ribbon protein